MRIISKPPEWVITCSCCQHVLPYHLNDVVNDCGAKVFSCCYCQNTIYIPTENARELLKDSPYKD